MPDVTIMVLAAAITLLAGATQGTVGFGFAAVSVPLLTLVDPVLTPIPQIMLALVLSISMAIRERTAIDLRGVRWLLSGRITGTLIGAWLLGLLTERTGSIVIGAVVLAAAVAMLAGLSIRRRPVSELGIGVISGTSGIVAGVGGPPLALLFANEEGPAIRSTLATVFVAGQSMSVFVLAVSGRMTSVDVSIAGTLLVPLLAGFVMSSWLRQFVYGPRLRRAIIVGAGLAALALLIQAT